MPTGVVPTPTGALVVAMDDGLHLVDPDTDGDELLTTYPDELGGRANDACADLAGNIITGTLNLGPAEGSAWWWSPTHGWKLLDPEISNTNGPCATATSLIIGDTATHYYAYPYEPGKGTVGERTVFGDTSSLDGQPDGAKLDAEGGLWCALVGGGQLARFTGAGLDQTVQLPVTNPTDVTFGGPDLNRMFVVSIGLGTRDDTLDGALLVVDGLQQRGRPEPRAAAG